MNKKQANQSILMKVSLIIC